MSNKRPSNILIKVFVSLFLLFAIFVIGRLTISFFDQKGTEIEGARDPEQKL